jgi:hypothetical protein
MKDTRTVTKNHIEKIRQVIRLLRDIHNDFPLESTIAEEIKIMDGVLWEMIDDAEKSKK